MAKEAIPLQHIKAVSPTLAETLRLCKLRAGLSRASVGLTACVILATYHTILFSIGGSA